MACFTVPAGEAVVTTIVKKTMEKKGVEKKENDGQVPMTRKLKWLSNLLWGGSALLAFEHVWHGEVVPWFPFLTAAESKEGIVEMLQEMSTVGVGMAVAVTICWCIMVLVADAVVKNTKTSKEASL